MAHCSTTERSWLAPAGLALLSVVLFLFPLLLRMPLCDPDEGLHAAIAQEMVERGDWITPRLLGVPFRDKPILYFWAEAASLACFGTNEAAVRLPGLLLAILGVVTTGMIGARLYDRRVGFVSAAFYATMIAPAALAQAPVHDVALVPLVNLAVLGFWEAQRAPTWGRRLLYSLKIGAALGLAGLAKGLAGVAVVGVAYCGYLLVLWTTDAYRHIRGRAPPAAADASPRVLPTLAVGVVALLVGVALAAVWYAAREARDPGYLRYFFIDRHVKGFATSTQFHHGAPFWYYLPVVLLGGLPWIAYLPAAAGDAWARRRLERSTLLLVAWLVGGLLFFTAARSKLVTYVWPLFPPVAVLAAVPWSRILTGALGDSARRDLLRTLRFSCWTGPLALPAVVLTTQAIFHIAISPLAWTFTLLAAGTAAIPLWFARSGRFAHCLTAAFFAVAVQFVVLMTIVTAPVARQFSACDLAAHYNARQEFPRQLVLVEERLGSLIFYLDKSLRLFLRPGQICAWRANEVRHWPRPMDQAELVVAEQRAKTLAKYLDLDGLPKQQAGRWSVYDAADVIPRLLVAKAKQHSAR